MLQTTDSPILRFLTSKENLPAVLEVIRYAEEVREHVAKCFWNRVEEAIKKNPKALSGFSWPPRELPHKSNACFNLLARPPGLSETGQGLRYTIETHPTYIGMGLDWNDDARQLEKLCQLQSFKTLQAELRKRLRAGTDYKPDRSWFWWEEWQRNPYTDPWSWFSSNFDQAFLNDLANKFWDFVLPIHSLVLEANKSLGTIRA